MIAKLVLLLLVILAALTLGQRRLLYFPAAAQTVAPADYQSVSLEGSDGALLAWYRPADPGRPTILFFNGNAGTLSGAAALIEPLIGRGFGALLLSYPGYEGNPGHPTEQGLYQAGRVALSWLAARGIERPLLMGWSLGSGVAMQMANEHASSGLILLAPFTSVAELASQRLLYLPLRLFVRDRYDNLAKIAGLEAPFLLIVHGEDDDVVPISEGRTLFDAAHGNKHFIALPGTGHNLTLQPVLAEIEALVSGR